MIVGWAKTRFLSGDLEMCDFSTPGLIRKGPEQGGSGPLPAKKVVLNSHSLQGGTDQNI